LTSWASLTAPQVWGVASHHAVLAEASHASDGASDARALPARLRPFCVRSRIALFVRCLPPSLPRRKACLGRSFVQTAERDLSTLAHGLSARALARSDPPLSSLREPRPECSLRLRPPFAHRSSNGRRAIFRRSRTHTPLAIRPARELGLAGQRPGKSDKGADAGSGAAGADVAIGGAIVEGRSRNVEMCPWRAVRHEFAQKSGGQ
jgi:hypothetical protein